MKWMAHINSDSEDSRCVSDTAVEAVAEELERFNELAVDPADHKVLTLEVYRCDGVEMPRVGYRVPELLAEFWEENGPDWASFDASNDQRRELMDAVNALVEDWSAKHGIAPDWYWERTHPELRVELAWGDDGGYPVATVSDEVWAMIEALDAAPQLDGVAP